MKKYVCCGDRAIVVEELGGQHGVTVAADDHGQVEGQHGLPGGGAAGEDQGGDQVLAEDVTGKRDMETDLRSCFELKKKVVCKDFEKTIYEVKSESFDWKVIDHIYCELKKRNDDYETST